MDVCLHITKIIPKTIIDCLVYQIFYGSTKQDFNTFQNIVLCITFIYFEFVNRELKDHKIIIYLNKIQF